MLNEWSDRDPEPRKRPYVLSGGFWSGVGATLVGLALVSGWICL